MPQHSPSEYEYFEEIELTQADYVDGDDNNVSLSAGQRGEIAQLEVGEDGQASGYDILTVGGRKEGESDTNPAIFVNTKDGTGTAQADTVQFRWVAKDKNGNRVRALTPWISQREADNADPRQRPEVVYRGFRNHTWVRDGKLLVLEAKDETASAQVDRASSVITHKAIAGSR